MSQVKKALITGITGQDGSYLVELLLEKGYEVFGIIRRSSSINTKRIDHLYKITQDPSSKLHLIHSDLSGGNMPNILAKVKPDEIYNLGAQSHVKVSFEIPEYTGEVTGLGVIRMLEAMKEHCPSAKFYQASSSEMFGDIEETPQNENTALRPRSPYGCAKVYGYWNSVNYRDGYNLFICNGILFNHESPRRGETFVSKKITKAVAKILAKKQDALYLGNLEAKRDWGYAKEYVEAMWLMLQQEKADDYVIATNETHSVKEFVEEAFSIVGLDWKKYVKIDERYIRPTEVNVLQGDYSKAVKILGWKPKTKFKELVKLMVKHDIEEEGLRFEDYYTGKK